MKAKATQEKISAILIFIILISIQLCCSLYLAQECVRKETAQEKNLDVFTDKVHKELRPQKEKQLPGRAAELQALSRGVQSSLH